MNTAIFGAYSDHDLYQRNRTLIGIIKELSERSVEIRPRRQDAQHAFASRSSGLQSLRRLLSELTDLWSKRHEVDDCDTIFVPYPAYLPLLLLRCMGRLRGRQVVADAFLELHSTVVEDRRLIPARSLRARLLLLLQSLSLRQADLVLIDTPEQAQALRRQLLSEAPPLLPVPVGIDERQWAPFAPPPLPADAPCRVLFWGTFIPLHGADSIVAAMRILSKREANIELLLIGDGHTASAIAADIEAEPVVGLHWKRRLVPTDELRSAVEAAHIVLGVFGESVKADSVVPYKVHQALASNRPVITRSSAAVAPLQNTEAGLCLCPAGDPGALADTIEELAARLRHGWQAQTRGIYEAHLSSTVLRQRLQDVFQPEAVVD